MSQSAAWEAEFTALFNQSVEKYRRGHQKAAGLVDAKGKVFLESIGCAEQEFFDFVDDFARGADLSPATALRVAAVRRDYFFQEQKGRPSSRQIDMAGLPAKEAQVEGIAWLPRLIEKAEAKLRGEMPPELMYGCGGDRKFFTAHQVDIAEFLRRVWEAKGDHKQVVAWVKSKSGA